MKRETPTSIRTPRSGRWLPLWMRGPVKSVWLAPMLGCAVLATVLVLSRSAAVAERELIAGQTEAFANMAADSLRGGLDLNGTGLERMADRYRRYGHPEKSDWEREASQFLRDLGFSGIGWYPTVLELRWGLGDMAEDSLSPAERRRLEHRRRRALASGATTYWTDRSDDGERIIFAVASPTPAFPEGVLIGVAPFTGLLVDSFAGGFGLGFAVVVRVAGEETFGTPGREDDETSALLVSRAVMVSGLAWEVEARPTAERMKAQRSGVAVALLVSGAMMAALLTLSLIAARGALMRAGELRAVSERLARQERALRRLNLELEDRVAARTAELERSNLDLEHFAYAASHDLQEPLRMVISYLQLLERRLEPVLDADGRDFIAFAVSGAHRMRAMVRGLLDYSRVATHGARLTPVDLGGPTRAALANLELALQERGARVSVADLPTIWGDPVQLEAVMQNLLHNALKYSRAENPRIEVDSRPTPDGFRVTVDDDGIGIPRDQSERVFEIFQRLHTQEEYAGTGIGLALCKRILERHGGQIGLVPSALGGTCVALDFPSERGTGAHGVVQG